MLVNNADVNVAAPIWELGPDLFERVCGSHVKGTYHCTRHAIPHMMAKRMMTTAVETFRQQGGDAAVRAENLIKAAQQPEDVAVLIASLCSEEAGDVDGQVFSSRKARSACSSR